jgi:leucyl-tRNA synthetase
VSSEPGVEPSRGDLTLRRATHRLLADIDQSVSGQRFNVAVARIMELVNATRKAMDGSAGPADPAVREAAEVVTIALSLVAPYVAEEMWERLGHAPSVANASWPAVDQSLLVTESVTCVVQVQGKVRGRLQVPPGISEDELRSIALADESVVRAVADREVAKVIIRTPKLVSIVVR